jgi:DNA-binding CsgD family transcriptional regulator/tetratricopeptide (TPR) repeat protein
MVLLERDTYLAEFERLLLEAAAGRGRLVFVGGEAGVGKTTFVSQVADSARKTARVLVGACDPMSTPRPLSPVLDIAATVGGTLERLLGDAGQPRHRILRGILAELSGGLRPTLAVFEDAHWADEATLDLLRFVGRRCGSTRLLRPSRTGTTRSADPSSAWSSATSPRRRRAAALASLSHGSGGAALAEGSALDPVELYRRTAGNPFFATEALASGSDAIPATVRDAVLARASRLTKAGRATLDAAAVIGAHGEAWLLAEVAGRDAPAVRDCVAAGVLRVDGEGFTFRHELARDAILESLPTARHLALHRRALEALRSRTPTAPDTLARLAHHAEGAADAPAVLEYAMAAARRASTLHAHRQARAQYARARRFADTLVPVDRAGLLEAYAYECHLTEAVDDAIAARQEALRIWRERGDDLRVGNGLGRLAGCFWYAGRNAEAEAAAQGALDILEGLPPGPELAMAYSTQAELRMLARDADAAIRWSEKAIELADRLGDRETLAHALNNLGSARLVSGVEGGWQALARSIRIAADADLEDHVARGYTNLGSGNGEVYEFTLADLFLSEGIAYCTERDLDHLRAYMTAWHALCRFFQGRWAEAAELAAGVLRQADLAAPTRIMALVALARVRVRRGDPEAEPLLDEALTLARRTDALQRLVPVHVARAEAAWLTGDPGRAAEEADAIYARAIDSKYPWLAGPLAYWRWRTGHLPSAPPWIGNAFALQIAGRWREAAAEWRRGPAPTRPLSRAAGDDPDALRLALADLERLGARRAAARVSRRLRELGIRDIPRGPRPATRANPAHLTAREAEVVRLVAQGLRNGEIAERLSVTAKTVDHHVSAALSKLGARSRLEAVKEAARLGLLGQG